MSWPLVKSDSGKRTLSRLVTFNSRPPTVTLVSCGVTTQPFLSGAPRNPITQINPITQMPGRRRSDDGPHLTRVVIPLGHRTTTIRHAHGQAVQLLANSCRVGRSQSWPARRSVLSAHPSIRGLRPG